MTVDSIKQGAAQIVRPYNDLSTVDSSFKISNDLGEEWNITMSHEELSAIHLPRSGPSLNLYIWLEEFFKFVGDHMPNVGEIHLDNATVKLSVYNKYKEDTLLYQFSPLSYNRFCEIWNLCFPYVKIREYKGVTGKCFSCTALSDARARFTDKLRLGIITKLHALHRSGYMCERMEYYRRIKQSLDDQANCMSIIVDGMAQIHCQIPWLNNQYDFGSYLPQHLQGCFQHGHSFSCYRTFHNCRNRTNLNIYCILREIEKRAASHGGAIPSELFCQTDGGPENKSKVFLAFCALLVAKRLFQRVIVTRLPVGHTHEDIDSIFALIWQKVKKSYCFTPDDYVDLIKEATAGKGTTQYVEDIFLIPDFVKFLTPCVDPGFGRFAVDQYTQHQWIFEAVEVDAQTAPTGVRTTFQKYASELCTVIVDDEREAVGLRAENIRSIRLPLQDEGYVNILRRLPTGDIHPEGFLDGGRKVLEKYAAKMSRKYSRLPGRFVS